MSKQGKPSEMDRSSQDHGTRTLAAPNEPDSSYVDHQSSTLVATLGGSKLLPQYPREIFGGTTKPRCARMAKLLDRITKYGMATNSTCPQVNIVGKNRIQLVNCSHL
jgi:hypothetical protein